MRHLVAAVRAAVEERNWYAALALALTLPDIAGRLESPGEGSQRRYVAWCDRFLVPRYTHPVGADRREHTFLSGRNCYALRCALLHEGSDAIDDQPAREALESFVFLGKPMNGSMVHCNQSDGKLQLQADIFCEDLCKGVEAWLDTVSVLPDVQARMAALMEVKKLEDGFSF